MGEIRSPYFSNGGGYLGDDAETRSPYFSSGGDYIGDNAEIDSPYSSFGNQDYHGDNAGIQSSYFSVGDYHEEDAEIPSESFFHQDHNLENPYNAEQVIVQTTYNTAKLLQQKNVKELRIDMEDEMEKVHVEIPDYEICIYKVPNALRRSKEDIFTPRQISIGPIHHGMTNWKPMKEQKVIYFQAFCNRVAEKTKEQKEKFMDKLSNTIIENKENIKQCYEDGAHEFEEYKFLKIVLLDAVFILEYLLRNEDIKKYEDEGHEDIKKYKYDPILSKMRYSIRWDLMLLENQLPFFILENLYLHLIEDGGEEYYTPFRTLACAYFNRYIKSQYKPSDDEKILHFTGLVRSLLSFSHPYLRTLEPIDTFYSATQLKEATIKIKESRNQCLLDVKFTSTKGELSIPRLEIDSTTECIFRNLMAFERCHYAGEECYISHYIKLFETLIRKPKDADLLIKNKIIRTNKDGAGVENLLKKLSEGTFEDYSCYYDLYQQLDKYYQKSWMENSALFLRKTYFGNVWKSTATFIAAILLVLTIVQTICSILSLR